MDKSEAQAVCFKEGIYNPTKDKAELYLAYACDWEQKALAFRNNNKHSLADMLAKRAALDLKVAIAVETLARGEQAP